MKKTMIQVARVATLAAVLAALAGCNTIAGVGQDISGSASRVAGWMGG